MRIRVGVGIDIDRGLLHMQSGSGKGGAGRGARSATGPRACRERREGCFDEDSKYALTIDGAKCVLIGGPPNYYLREIFFI